MVLVAGCFPHDDRFDSIHEKLIVKWKDAKDYLSSPLHFVSADTEEDRLTTAYMRDTAEQAGLTTRQLLMEEIGWNGRRGRFVDSTPAEDEIRSLFKLTRGEA